MVLIIRSFILKKCLSGLVFTVFCFVTVTTLGCATQLQLELDSSLVPPSISEQTIPLRAALVLPSDVSTAKLTTNIACTLWGKPINLSVSYGQQWEELVMDTFAPAFTTVQLVHDKTAAAAPSDVVIDLKLPVFKVEPRTCWLGDLLMIIAFWQIWPFFVNPPESEAEVNLSGSVSDANSKDVLAEWTAQMKSKGILTDSTNPAIADDMKEALQRLLRKALGEVAVKLITSSRFTQYVQERARIPIISR